VTAPVEYAVAVGAYPGQAPLAAAPGVPDLAHRVGLAARRPADPRLAVAPRRGPGCPVAGPCHGLVPSGPWRLVRIR
jgi:hypothetical protein